MTKEQKVYKALQDVFIGAKIEGRGGFVNLIRFIIITITLYYGGYYER